jgi:hypothetical protein
LISADHMSACRGVGMAKLDFVRVDPRKTEAPGYAPAIWSSSTSMGIYTRYVLCGDWRSECQGNVRSLLGGGRLQAALLAKSSRRRSPFIIENGAPSETSSLAPLSNFSSARFLAGGSPAYLFM